jgi:hypothetical protein
MNAVLPMLIGTVVAFMAPPPCSAFGFRAKSLSGVAG